MPARTMSAPKVSVRVGRRDLAAQSMMAEQRAQARRCHRLTAPTAFERNEQRWRVGQRPFQMQVALQHFHDLAGQGQSTLLLSLAQYVQERVG